MTVGALTTSRLGRRRGLWWLSPHGVAALVVLIPLLAAWRIGDEVFRNAWRTPKVLTGATVALFIAGLLVFVGGSLLAQLGSNRQQKFNWPGLDTSQRRILSTSSNWLFGLTMLGYAAFTANGLANGASLGAIRQAILEQSVYSGTLRAAFSPVPGVTTLTQLGIAYVVVATLLLMNGPAPGVRRRLLIVLGLAFVRSFVVSERLALIELLVPMLALAAMMWSTIPRRGVRYALHGAPIILVPCVIAVFGAFEYSRSWVFFSATRGGTYVDFVVERLLGYYVTAFNNGQLSLMYERRPGRLPYQTWEVFWTAPGVQQLGLYDRLAGGATPGDFTTVIGQHGNPEFNSNCGICGPFTDYGVWGGLIFLAVLGAVLGYLYLGFARGGFTSMLIYPPLVTGLYEFPRYMYWTQGRLLTPVAALVIVALVQARKRAGEVGDSRAYGRSFAGRH